MTAATPIHKPRSLKQAQRLCELYTELAGKVAAIEEERDAAIAAANARADELLAPLLQERDQIAEKVEPWFLEAKDELLDGKRKSIELGGCELGTRKGKAKLGIAGNKDDAVEKLGSLRWAKPFLKTTVSLDVPAISKGLLGKHGSKLHEEGFAIVAGIDVFYMKRTEQGGTLAKVG